MDDAAQVAGMPPEKARIFLAPLWREDVVIIPESRVEASARVAERFYFDKNLGACVGDVPSDL